MRQAAIGEVPARPGAFVIFSRGGESDDGSSDLTERRRISKQGDARALAGADSDRWEIRSAVAQPARGQGKGRKVSGGDG
ncbi:hypothetical protein CXK90_19325 [Stutzerimonas stutzeri]|nr:hypothetical protein CXK90_19325 [Stutzerimonas stutzeri]